MPPSTLTLHNEMPSCGCSGQCQKVGQLLDGIDQIDGLAVIHPGDIGDVVVHNGGGGGRRSEGLCSWL